MKTGISAIAIALAPVALWAGATYNWDASVLSGLINASSSWVGGTAPGLGESGKFGNDTISSPATYTVTIPEGTFYDESSTWINGLPSGTKVIFDASNSTWVKARQSNDASWNGYIFRVDNADHIFNIEDINAENEKDPFGFTLANGKISYTAADSGDHLDFESGTFNNAYLEDGTTESSHNTVFQYSVHKQGSKVIMKEGSASYLRNVQVRGATPGGEWLIEGGDHHIVNGLNIKCWNGEADGVVHVSGGSLAIDSGAMWLGHNTQGAGRLVIDGTGTFTHGGNATYFPDNAGGYGYLAISGHGTYTSSTSGIAAGHNGGNAIITVSENGSLILNGPELNLAEGNNGTASLTITDNGFVRTGNFNGANGSGRTASVSLADNGTLWINGGTFANNATSSADFEMTGGTLSSWNQGTLNFGDNNAGVQTVNLTGGTIDNSAGKELSMAFLGGQGSSYSFDGVDAWLRNIAVEGQGGIADFTNTVAVKSGTLHVQWRGGGEGIDIRGASRNAMFLVEGGTAYIGNMIRLGHGAANNGGHAIFRQTGGTVYQSGVVNMCDSASTSGEFELLGGVFYGKDIRGWNNSTTRTTSNNGWAKCYFNGGTLKPYQDNITVITTMDEAELGSAGLVFDTDNRNNCSIRVKFTESDGVEGRFVKTGGGTLTARLTEESTNNPDYSQRSLNGEFSHCVVDKGTLLLADRSDCVFGNNVVVQNGAVLSLSGNPVSLTVESITIGNGTGLSSVYLDSGDVIYVTGNNGIAATSGAIDGSWTGTNGTYPVFVCSGTVSQSELDKITVVNADPDKDYAWVTSEDGGVTTCSLVISDITFDSTVEWEGDESSNWSTAGNWNSAAVPTRKAIASFGDVANKSVVSADGAVAGKLDFTVGGYTLSGSDAITVVAGIELEAGTLALSAPLYAGRTFALEVAADAVASVSGNVSGSGTDFVKTGSGKAVLSGDNSGMTGSLIAAGGTLEATAARALGASTLVKPLTLRSGTFAYTGSAASFTGAIKVDADADKKAVILNNTGDLTFTDAQYGSKGVFIKRGTGALNLNLPAGNYYIGSGANEQAIGENAGAVSLPASGDSPTSDSGLYGVTLLEGELKVTGVGIDSTVLNTGNSALIGGGYAAAVPAGLVVENARVNWGAGSRHGCFARDIPSGGSVPYITLNNAYLWSDSMTIGASAAEVIRPMIAMTNSVFWNHYNSSLANGNVHPIISAKNSKLESDGMIGWFINSDLDALFTGSESRLGSLNRDVTSENGKYGKIVVNGSASGTLRFEDGATLAVTRGLEFNNSQTASGLALVFDGGVFAVFAHNTEKDGGSYMSALDKQGFTTVGNGLSIDIAEGIAHSIAFPVRGAGGVVKTGTGTLAVTNIIDNVTQVEPEGVAVFQQTGELEVAEGTLVLDGSLAADTTKLAVDEGALLDLYGSNAAIASFTGAGTVTNGAFTAGKLVYDTEAAEALKFLGATLPANQLVEFDFNNVAPVIGTSAVVANIVDAAGEPLEALDVSGWKGVSSDRSIQSGYSFAYDTANGNVVCTYERAVFGITIMVR